MKKQDEFLHRGKRSSTGGRCISIMLILCMVLSIVPTTVFAADTISGDGYSYNTETKVLTLTTSEGTTAWRKDANILKDTVTAVIVADTVTEIGDNAFYSCPELTRIEIGTGVAAMDNNAFTTDPKLTTITVAPENTAYKSVDNVIFTSDGKKLVKYPEGKADTSYNVPDGVETIGSRAFLYNPLITTVSFPNSVTEIADTAFWNCKNLTTISLGTSLVKIGAVAFSSCEKLSFLELPPTVTEIGGSVFSGSGLVAIAIPESVTSIGAYAFRFSSKLRTVIMDRSSAPTLGTGVFDSCDATIYAPADSSGYDAGGWPTGKVLKGRAGLSGLKLDKLTLSPAFSAAVTSYTATMSAASGTDTTVTPTIGAGTSVTVNDTIVASGSASNPISLTLGENTITVVVANSTDPAETRPYTITVMLTTPEPTPSATFTATGISSGTLGDVAAGMKYSVDGGTNWVLITGTSMEITGVTAAKGVKVYQPGNGTTTTDSPTKTISVTMAPALTGTAATECTTSSNNDGTLTGVSNLMEYKKDGAASYTAITGSKVTGLVPGTYHVRVKATGTVLAGPDVTLTVAAFKKTPTLSDLEYSLDSVTFDGIPKPLSVIGDVGVITVKYNGSTVAPTNAGTYTVTVDITENTDYKAATGLSLGAYTINKIAYTGTTTVSASILVSGQTGAIVTLPDLPAGASYGTPVAGGTIAMTGMSIAGTTLTYTAPASTAGQTGTMTIPVTGATNYNDYSIVVTVTYTAKTPQVISYAAATVAKTYGDVKFVNPLTQTTVKGTITYTSDDTSVATVNPSTGEVTIVAVGDGSAAITATAAETGTHAQATESYTVTVAPKALTLRADDKSMTKGDGLPTFTYTATGLVYGDAVTTAPTMSTTTNGTAVGTFDITISGGVVANAASYDITYTKGTLTVAERLFTVTVTNGTGSGNYAEGATVTITANDRSGYTFTGWSGVDVTFADATAKTTTFIMPAKAVTVTANYRQNSSGDGGGSGGGGSSSNNNSSPVIVTPPTPDKPNSPTQGEIKVPGTVDSKGNVTVSITDKTVTDAFDKALAEAKKNGTEQNGITVVLRVDTGNKPGSNVMVNLPKAVQDTIIAKKIVNTIVVVDNPDIRIGMDLATVQEINKQAKSDVNLTATPTDSVKLTGDAKKSIGSRPVFDLEVNYGSGNQVQNFGKGSVSVTIPYTLGANEKAENVCAVYVDGNGKVHWLTSSVYDSVEKVLRFSTDHFSTYGIGYKQTDATFTDIASHWAKEDIEFVVSRGLFSGTSTTTFSPNTAMTRGMFVTALGRLANADVSSYKQSSFTDVKNDAYYMGYIEWASKNSIVNGTGNGKFAPDQAITREQMAVIMSNYAKTMDLKLPQVQGENTFADSAKISAYAKNAVKQMQMAGVISGKSGNLFDSQGTATRAEVSAVLHRFVELATSSDNL